MDLLRDEKKEMDKAQKEALKEQRALVTREYGFCVVDGRIEKVGNITVEPPSLFRGRGTHPKMGKLKVRSLLYLRIWCPRVLMSNAPSIKGRFLLNTPLGAFDDRLASNRRR